MLEKPNVVWLTESRSTSDQLHSRPKDPLLNISISPITTKDISKSAFSAVASPLTNSGRNVRRDSFTSLVVSNPRELMHHSVLFPLNTSHWLMIIVFFSLSLFPFSFPLSLSPSLFSIVFAVYAHCLGNLGCAPLRVSSCFYCLLFTVSICNKIILDKGL